MLKNSLKLTKAKNIQRVCARLLAAEPLTGESWNPDYEKEPEFQRLVDANASLDIDVWRAFRKINKDADILVNWDEYNRRLNKKLEAQSTGLLENLTSEGWKAATITLTEALGVNLSEMIEIGGQRTERETGIVLGWTKHMTEPKKFIRTYTFDLVKNLNNTTRSRLQESLTEGINRGLDQKAMTKEIEKVINDRVRAQTIANTETVRAYNSGRVAAMERTGLKYKKRWLDNQPDSCPICLDLHGHKPIDQNKKFFSKVTGLYYDTPPDSHPNCRCSLEFDVVG